MADVPVWTNEMQRLTLYYNSSCPLLVSYDCYLMHFSSVCGRILKNDTQLLKAWTCEEIGSYCPLMEKYASIINGMNSFTYLGRAQGTTSTVVNNSVFGPISLVCNILLLVTMCSPRLTGRVFWYLRAIALAQIVQSINMILYGRGGAYEEYGPFWPQFWFALAGQSCVFYFAKTFAISLALFMSLDRLICVCFPSIKVNWTRYFIAVFVVSFLIGVVQLFGEYLITYDQEAGGWTELGEWNTKRSVFFGQVLQPILVFYQIGTIILCSVFSVCIIIALRQRSRRVAQMVTSTSAVLEHKKMMFLCRVQLVDTIALFIDLYIVICQNLLTSAVEWMSCPQDECFYPAKYTQVSLTRNRLVIFFNIRPLLEGTSHAELFFFYLAIRRFRRAFVLIFVAAYKKVKESVS